MVSRPQRWAGGDGGSSRRPGGRRATVTLTGARSDAYGQIAQADIIGRNNRHAVLFDGSFAGSFDEFFDELFDVMDMKGRRMGRLEAAADRLDKALADLEAALARRAERDSESYVGRLQLDFDRLRGEHAGLRDTAGTVAGRLDTLVQRLDGLLETDTVTGGS
jgi:hypothetical protein